MRRTLAPTLATMNRVTHLIGEMPIEEGLFATGANAILGGGVQGAGVNVMLPSGMTATAINVVFN